MPSAVPAPFTQARPLACFGDHPHPTLRCWPSAQGSLPSLHVSPGTTFPSIPCSWLARVGCMLGGRRREMGRSRGAFVSPVVCRVAGVTSPGCGSSVAPSPLVPSLHTPTRIWSPAGWPWLLCSGDATSSHCFLSPRGFYTSDGRVAKPQGSESTQKSETAGSHAHLQRSLPTARGSPSPGLSFSVRTLRDCRSVLGAATQASWSETLTPS